MIRHNPSTVRTDWIEGPMFEADAETLAAAMNHVAPGSCDRGDRHEGAFVTRHYGVLTVGVRGCRDYREKLINGFEASAAQYRYDAKVATTGVLVMPGRCHLHSAFEADNCPGCGTSVKIGGQR